MTMPKPGSIVCKLRPCLPKGPANCTYAHHSDRGVTAAIFAKGTYFVDTPRTIHVFACHFITVLREYGYCYLAPVAVSKFYIS
jgi:hypothetical protein